ncbi:MAG TPA: NADH-quinone oxidoreductase subunit C [Vicinamibacterales bacterium]|nr:NADH-quinone oxidoreductase subunit C [Vicinamibacterales bacterium]
MADAAALVASIQSAVPDAAIEPAASIDLQPTIYVTREQLPAVARALRDQADLKFAFLAELTAADYWPHEPRFEVVYVLVSIEHKLRLRMKVRLPAAEPHLATVSAIWPAANWLEREVWDMFGIVFDGHPDPRRLLMPEDWEGFPLRKDSPVQIRRPTTTFEPLQVTAEEFRENVQRDRLSRET